MSAVRKPSLLSDLHSLIQDDRPVGFVPAPHISAANDLEAVPGLVLKTTLYADLFDDRTRCGDCSNYVAERCEQRITPIGVTTADTLHRCRFFQS